LPDGFTFSAGIKAGASWIVSVHQIDGLVLFCPPEITGTFHVEVSYVKDADAEPQLAHITVEVIAAAPRETGPKMVASAQNGAADIKSVKFEPAQAGSSEHDRMMRRAAELMNANDIVAARLIYMRLAKDGNREAALAVARSYDPTVIAKFKLAGLSPDAEKARAWYARAESLGLPEKRGPLVVAESSMAGK
jgi:hypothetical protein